MVIFGSGWVTTVQLLYLWLVVGHVPATPSPCKDYICMYVCMYGSLYSNLQYFITCLYCTNFELYACILSIVLILPICRSLVYCMYHFIHFCPPLLSFSFPSFHFITPLINFAGLWYNPSWHIWVMLSSLLSPIQFTILLLFSLSS